MTLPIRRSRPVVIVAVFALVGLLVPLLDAGAAAGDPRREREKVRRQGAELAAEVDLLRAQDADVAVALQAMNANVATQEALLAGAQQAVAQAEEQLSQAQAAEQEAMAVIADLRIDLREMAIATFVGGEQAMAPPAESLTPEIDLSERARRQALADLVVGTVTDVEDALGAAREDLEVARQEAETSAKKAADRRSEVASRLDQVTAARDGQEQFGAQLDARIESRLAEAASLSRLDEQLGAEIHRQQEALARQNVARPSLLVSAGPPAGNVPLRNVRGIYVHQDIADELEAMLATAERDGISLSGGGYRDPGDQRRLREQNCPDPARSPASSCRPPTARPGQSMHERGLAVDLTYQGRVITSRSSPAFRWLAANAESLGFYNLPSEPWHWSTNGR